MEDNKKPAFEKVLDDINKKNITVELKISKYINGVQTALANINKQFTQTLESPKTKSLFERLRLISKTHEILISARWIFPDDIDEINFMKELESSRTSEDVDNYMMHYYGSTNSVHKMTSEINENGIFSTRLISLIKEANLAYDMELFNSCAIVLLSVVEGLIVRFSDVQKLKYTNASDIFKTSALDRGGHVRARYYYVITSICEFISCLYQKSDFSNAEPAFLNRHWVLHGRSQREIYPAECVKLFLFINSMNSFINEIDEQSEYDNKH